jgi:D-glycero-D-manno-heptose 1,7-bisphosphate phosphatase
MKPIVLDRDGVINVDSDDYVKTAAEWVPIPGSIEAIAKLSQAGYDVFVATNQSGLGRELFTLQDLTEMHEKFLQLVTRSGGKVTAVCYCPHTPSDNCDCRKPKTGLLAQIEADHGCNLAGAYFIGDSVRDIQAGASFGCKPILVKTGKGEMAVSTLAKLGLSDFLVFNDLADAVAFITSTDANE